MKMLKNKIADIAVTIFFMLSMAASMALIPSALAQVPPVGTQVPTYAFISVGPNPIGVGQTATINMYLANPNFDSSSCTNFTVVEKTPGGTSITLGPFHSDATGGTFTTVVPTVVGNYSFQFFYGGQTLAGNRTATNYAGLVMMPSQSPVEYLTVQTAPVTHETFPFTPLPTTWWQTPVPAENSQNWYTMTGAWLGFGSVTFATTGGYNSSCSYNPYTPDVMSAHVIWTKPWTEGGLVGGDLGGDEAMSSFWSTSQYQPKVAPVIMNGIYYSQLFSTNMGTNMGMGIYALDIYTGQTLYVINTTNTLRCGMLLSYHQINQYGVLGPFIWTNGALPAGTTGGTYVVSTGTQWNMWDAFTGHYMLSLVNGSSPTLTTDDRGNIIGYYTNTTAGTMLYHPMTANTAGNVYINNTGTHESCWNMTVAIGQTGGSWQPSLNTVRNWAYGITLDFPVPMTWQGNAISLSGGTTTGGNIVLTQGSPISSEQLGWSLMCSMNMRTGAVNGIWNLTSAQTTALLPYTRTNGATENGLRMICNDVSNDIVAQRTDNGQIAWDIALTGDNGATPDPFNLFDYSIKCLGNKQIEVMGMGGDIWSINGTTGKVMWYTNTTKLVGPSGIETPYNVWPLWIFNCQAQSNGVSYWAVGHEYNPPLFHGAKLIGVNNTNGKMIWQFLDCSMTSTEISYGVLISLNAYDNQLWAQAKGPSGTTVTAPNIGVTTDTPVTITGTVMDVSPGTQQLLVKSNFPYGLPCVSDASESAFMEAVYEQQVMPTNITGVPVTLTEIDHNGNTYTIGTTTSDESGTFAYQWTPPIVGNYTIVATFAGSNSYYGSCAETHIYANPPPATPAPTASPITGLVSWSSFELGIALVVIVLVVIGAVLAVLVMRKRP